MTNPLANISLGFVDAFGISLLGFCIVFCVLVILMVVIRMMRVAIERYELSKQAVPVAAAVASAAPAGPVKDPNMVPAKGSLGDIKLHDVDDRTAALIMAIVADEMKTPLNELRFLSIREKK